jgi:hypothetical protein
VPCRRPRWPSMVRRLPFDVVTVASFGRGPSPQGGSKRSGTVRRCDVCSPQIHRRADGSRSRGATRQQVFMVQCDPQDSQDAPAPVAGDRSRRDVREGREGVGARRRPTDAASEARAVRRVTPEIDRLQSRASLSICRPLRAPASRSVVRRHNSRSHAPADGAAGGSAIDGAPSTGGRVPGDRVATPRGPRGRRRHSRLLGGRRRRDRPDSKAG